MTALECYLCIVLTDLVVLFNLGAARARSRETSARPGRGGMSAGRGAVERDGTGRSGRWTRNRGQVEQRARDDGTGRGGEEPGAGRAASK